MKLIRWTQPFELPQKLRWTLPSLHKTGCAISAILQNWFPSHTLSTKPRVFNGTRYPHLGLNFVLRKIWIIDLVKEFKDATQRCYFSTFNPRHDREIGGLPDQSELYTISHLECISSARASFVIRNRFRNVQSTFNSK
jgi:hypothetical protein